MAIKQIMLAKKIESKRSLLTTVESDLDQIKQRSADVERAIEEAATDEEIEAVEKTVEEIEQELAEKEAEKEKIEQEIADLQAELDEANKNEPKADAERGGKKDMKKRSKEELAEIRSGINKF
ncbi:phage major capsid protein, partial [Listeria monocytogenes]|nr:phage major capsid protein [Listeria monocytogenes]